MNRVETIGPVIWSPDQWRMIVDCRSYSARVAGDNSSLIRKDHPHRVSELVIEMAVKRNLPLRICRKVSDCALMHDADKTHPVCSEFLDRTLGRVWSPQDRQYFDSYHGQERTVDEVLRRMRCHQMLASHEEIKWICLNHHQPFEAVETDENVSSDLVMIHSLVQCAEQYDAGTSGLDDHDYHEAKLPAVMVGEMWNIANESRYYDPDSVEALSFCLGLT